MTSGEAILTHRARFCASHFYYLPEWPREKNLEIFGKSANRNGHGHNYLAEISMKGPVNPKTGMVMNIQDLKAIIREVLEELDHKNLNLEVPVFAEKLPTPENISLYLWEAVSKRLPVGKLHSVRVFEDENLCAEYRGGISSRLSRTYRFSAAHRLNSSRLSEDENRELYGKCNNPKGHGHNYTLEVTVSGKAGIESFNAVKNLDRLVQERIIRPWDHRNLDEEIGELKDKVSTGEHLAQIAMEKLKEEFKGPELVSVKVGETADAFFEVCGEPPEES